MAVSITNMNSEWTATSAQADCLAQSLFGSDSPGDT
jgi:hypothetical protein